LFGGFIVTQNSTALPDLRMLPTDLLVPHEDCDPRRVEKLSLRVLEEGSLKNPPVVAAVPNRGVASNGAASSGATQNQRYVVLDGANRTMSFAHLRIPHIVAQLVRYEDPGVILDTWYHVVSGMDPDQFEGALSQLEGLRLEACSLEAARSALETEQALAYIVKGEGVRKVISTTSRKPRNMAQLNTLVNIYKGRADIFRASNDIWEIQKPYYPEIIALVIFPRLRPEDIMQAARDGEKVPSGITRHIIPARALNINIPIGILMADWSLERKEAWLDKWWMERMAANAIRFYAESTFSFNE
jgi:hypothetical protein